MQPAEYVQFDAMGLANLVHRGEVTPQELTEAAVERIESLNGKLNAVVERAFDSARTAAAGIDRRLPLAGVPFLAKDMNIDVAGLHLTSSCRWLAQLPPAIADAPLAARWRSAGLSILGRTNTPEFAGDFVTEPTWRGATANPWDLARSPGGSSGGAAAAVASGMVPIAHATDSGGSIRVPASACGLVGLKPSRGWVPVGPQHDELAGGFDCEHVLSRSVRDTALMLDLTQGAEPVSRYPLRHPARSFAEAVREEVRPLRIGVALRTPGGDLPADEIGAAATEAAEMLARAGHRISEFQYPKSAAQIAEPAAVIWMTATAEEIDFARALLGSGPKPHELEALSWACAALGDRRSALDYVRARRVLTQATRDMAAAFQSIDVLLSPTTSQCALLTGSIDGRTAKFDLERWNADSYGYAPYTELFNVTGQPAISLPLAQSRAGLPIGVQFVAPLGEDARLLMLAARLERERPWESRLAALRRRYLS
ncbi:MAG TPA: amidase [Steroidobacteraceae bacterium]|jgi:amidase